MNIQKRSFLAGTCSFSLCLLCKSLKHGAAKRRNLKEKHDRRINILNETVGQIDFRVVCYANLKIGQQNGVTWKDMIDISFSTLRPCEMYLFQFDVFQTMAWLTAGAVFPKVSITSPIMVSNVFRHPWSQLTSPNVLWSSSSHLLLTLTVRKIVYWKPADAVFSFSKTCFFLRHLV